MRKKKDAKATKVVKAAKPRATKKVESPAKRKAQQVTATYNAQHFKKRNEWFVS